MPDNKREARRLGWRGRTVRVAVVAAAAAGLAGVAAAPAFASPQHSTWSYDGHAIELVAVTPSPHQVAGRGGVFNVDLAALARNSTGNSELSAANGYKPGILPTPAPGIGHPDPFAPGLVVLLSSTPQASGGPDANLAGVFQLTDVVNNHGLDQVLADWEVGKPGAFGDGTQVTLTAFLVSGTAPGIVPSSAHPISNVVRETFTIGS
jgi:hypothetical protein